MKIQWECALPTNKDSRDYHYESQILVKDGKVYYLSYHFSELCVPRSRLQLNIIDAQSGSAEFMDLPSLHSVIPSQFILFAYKDKIIFYTGEFWMYDGKSVKKFLQVPMQDGVKDYLLMDNRLIYASNSWNDGVDLWCCNLDTLEIEWQTDVSNSKRYKCGQISMLDGQIVCNGNDALLFIDPGSGAIESQIKIPRIDKLFYPIRSEDGNLLIGYTNWTNAGILKYDESQSEVIWRHKRKFEGPQLDCKLYCYENLVYWVKNETELICLNCDTGEEIFARRTVPWLYTDLRFVGDKILYGTAGANGYFNCIDARSGAERCSVFLQNGCAFYGFYPNTVVVGDFSKTMRQISLHDGSILQTLPVDGEVVGDIRVYDGCVYTVIWASEKKPVRLIKIKI